jgi:Na+/melibiose symporter-like transporter
MNLELSRPTKLAYGVGATAVGIKNTVFHIFVFFYFSQVLGLAASLAGAASLVALVVDAVTDPMVGDLSDRWQSPRGRRHPFILGSALPFAIGLAALLNPPGDLDQTGLFLWMVAGSVAVRIVLTFFFVPHLSLGAELSTDYQVRTQIVSYRVFFMYGGGMLTSVVGLNLFFPASEAYPNGMLNPDAYGMFGVCMGLLACFVILVSYFGTRKLIPNLPRARENDTHSHLLSGLLELIGTLRLRSFRVIFGGSLITMIASGVTQTLTFYVGTYFFELTPGQISILALAMVTALVPASFVAPWLSRVFDKKPSLLGAILLLATFEMAPLALRLLGFFPENGSPFLVPALFTLLVISNCGLIVYTIIIDSMLADIVDEHELETGRRQEGVFFSARSFASKATFGVGSFAAGLGLDAIAFPRQASVEALTPASLLHLGLLAGPCIFALYLAALSVFSRYAIDHERHASILAGLAGRRTDAASE